MRRHVIGRAMMLVLAVAAHAAAEELPDARAKEVATVRNRSLVVHDGKGHFLAVGGDGASPSADRTIAFYGDGKTFYRVFVKLFGDQGGSTSWSIVDPRSGPHLALSQLARGKGGAYTMTCRSTDGITQLTAMGTDEARALLDKAVFRGARMNREAYALGRDGTTYYYVDVARAPVDNTDFHVYAGKRGAMKRLAVKSLAVDVDGVVFSTRGGNLKLVHKPLALTWKRAALSILPITSNLELVYKELGIYSGKKFGLPCDDM